MTDTRPTYPPERHLLRDLAVTTERVSPVLTICSIPLVPEIRHTSGRARVGALAAIIDLAGAATALSSVSPDWIATADLAFTASGPIVEGPIVVAAHLVRAGANVVVVRVEVGDGRGNDDVATMRPAGRGLMTFARIPGSASTISGRTIPASSPKQSIALPTSGFRLPLFAQLGIRVIEPALGSIEIDRTDYTRNSFGSLNGGAIAIAAEAAAEALVASHGQLFEGVDISVNYLSQTRSGPGRTIARLLRLDAYHAVVEVQLVDAGHDHQLLALSTVLLQAR
ncbi:MAG TPA: hotdog domain-containing protein [Acidimicrobiales bacterium]|nr:hotdog domain-containing protein [Acidimicrobiales bacterium]